VPATSEPRRDALLAHVAEDRQKMSNAQQFANLLAEIDELDAAAGVLGRDMEPHQGAESHAVDEGEIGKIKHNALAAGNQFTHLVQEKVAHAYNQPSVAMDGVDRAVVFDFEGELTSSCNIRHLIIP